MAEEDDPVGWLMRRAEIKTEEVQEQIQMAREAREKEDWDSLDSSLGAAVDLAVDLLTSIHRAAKEAEG